MLRRKFKTEEEHAYARTRRRIIAKKLFYIHFIVFVGIGLILNVLGLAISGARFWLLFPMLPLGIILFIHYSIVFGFPFHIGNRDWEEEDYPEERRLLYQAGEYKEDHLELKKLDRSPSAKKYRETDFV